MSAPGLHDTFDSPEEKAIEREAEARNALRDARLELDPVKPDGQGRNERGELELWLTAERVANVASDVLAGNDLAIELAGAKIAGNIMNTAWRWVHHTAELARWESPVTEVSLAIDYSSQLNATSASKAAITAARKTYTEELLGIRKASEPMRELELAVDGSRQALRLFTQRMLGIYCRRQRVTEAAALTAILGVVRGPDGGPPAFEGLIAVQLASLCVGLLTRLPDVAAYDPGLAPAGMEAVEDQLPEEMM